MTARNVIIIVALLSVSCEKKETVTDNSNQTTCNETCDRMFTWSGFTWCVKNTNETKCGPGPNYFSPSTENVWVDNAGELHLRITKRNGRYYCAEVYTTDVVGYGVYAFYLSSRVDILDKNIVVGLFTWDNKNCKTNANSEIDIEFARWGNGGDPTVLQYSVQPTNEGHETDRFYRAPMQLNGDYSLHFFNWTPNLISWSSHHGHTNPPPQGNFIASWSFDSNHNPKSKTECSSNPIVIPAPESDTKIDLNLWLDKGNAPSNDQETEVIIHRVDYYPAMPTQGLVAYYPFNGNANDESGNGNNGINYGSTLTKDRFGIDNHAYSFNGSSNWIKIEHSSSLDITGNTSLSICAWVNTTKNVGRQGIVSKWKHGVTDAYLVHLQETGIPNFHVSGCGAIGVSDPLTTNTWHFLTCVLYNQSPNSLISYFIDGVLVKRDTILSCSIGSNTRYIEIGGYSDQYFFSGKLDDVRIFKRALTDSEIQSLYHEGGY